MHIKKFLNFFAEVSVTFLMWMGVMFIDYMRVNASIEHKEIIIVFALALTILSKTLIFLFTRFFRENPNIE